MKITIATLLLVLGFCISTFSQKPDLAKIKAMPDDTLKIANFYMAAKFHLDINIKPNKLYGYWTSIII